MTTLELLKEAIEVGHPRDAQALVYQCLEEGLSSSEIIDQAMIPAMKSAENIIKIMMLISRGFYLLPEV